MYSNFKKKYIWFSFIFLNQLKFFSGQTYLEDLTEPVFDQSVYVKTLNKSIEINTIIFTFTVRTQLIHSRLSYELVSSSGSILGNLTVISNHSDFVIRKNNDGTYSLINTIS
jgi:hypothetical protein